MPTAREPRPGGPQPGEPQPGGLRPGELRPRELRELPVPAGAAALTVLPDLRRALSGEGPALLPVPAGSESAPALGAGEPLEPGEDDPADPTALVIATSGSTGTPKGVLLPAAALRASAESTHRYLGGPGHWLLAMPAHHIAGIQVLVRSLIAGTDPDAVDASDGFRPERFAEAARRTLATQGRHYTAMVPTQLHRLLDDAATGLDALRGFDAVLLGGAATPPALLRRAREAGVRVVTTYGMSETSGGCVYDGVPLDGVRVRVETQSGAAQSGAAQTGAAQTDKAQTGAPHPGAPQSGTAEPGATGPVSLSGPTLARGYRRQRAAAFDGDWFRTGDLGRWSGDRLEIVGRADDLIITGGVNIAPAQVERVLGELDGVREVCVLGVDDAEWGQAVVAAVVPADPVAPPRAEALRAAVRAEAGSAAVPKRVEFLTELPLRGPGKPDRRALRSTLHQ